MISSVITPVSTLAGSWAGLPSVATFTAPQIDYLAVAPMLIVFGAALVSVLVESFAPRANFFPTLPSTPIRDAADTSATIGLAAVCD